MLLSKQIVKWSFLFPLMQKNVKKPLGNMGAAVQNSGKFLWPTAEGE